jgi:predicted 3-demethylubiquinone-9 3-methyltransferase (glyoxalase superfamily)
MQKITPFLWFENNAEEAVKYYVEIFANAPSKNKSAKIVQTTHYDEVGAKASGQKAGSVMTVGFELEGLEFVAINGGPFFKFSGAISFVINCQDQEEVDYFWEKLSVGGGEKGQCGWINHDKYGITWQVVPTVLTELLSDPDGAKAQRVMEAMIKMTKIEIAELEKAATKTA